MSPTSFDFRVTMPGDERLVGAIRELASHAAGYVKLAGDSRQGWTGHVERAAEAAVAVTGPGEPLIEFRFLGREDCLEVVISCEAAPAAAVPASTTNGTVTVDWRRDGSRQTCHIRQRLTA